MPGSVCYSELPGLLFYDALHQSGAEGLGLLPFVLVPLKRINNIYWNVRYKVKKKSHTLISKKIARKGKHTSLYNLDFHKQSPQSRKNAQPLLKGTLGRGSDTTEITRTSSGRCLQF